MPSNSNAPAIAMIEFGSIGMGIRAGDAMAKKAPLESFIAGTVQPGKFLVLISGDVASVQEALQAGIDAGAESVLGTLLLPYVHRSVWEALQGQRTDSSGEALGIIETRRVVDTIRAADAAVKGAQVTLREIRLADGLGGHAFCLLSGQVQDVEAALELGVRMIPDAAQLISQAVIPQLDADMDANLNAGSRFGDRVVSHNESGKR
ncbi:MAG: BMC domain-containing protein [Anaerolineae bacterium]